MQSKLQQKGSVEVTWGNCNGLCLEEILPMSGKENRPSCDPSITLLFKLVLEAVASLPRVTAGPLHYGVRHLNQNRSNRKISDYR